MRIFLSSLLLLIFSPALGANSLVILAEEKCSKDSIVIELTTLESTNTSTMSYCADSQLSIFGEDIDNVIKLAEPSEEEMKDIKAEFKFMKESMDLSGMVDVDEISYSEYQIVLNESGESKFKEMLRQSGGRMLLTHDEHLLTTMNFDLDNSSGNTITILSGSLTMEAKKILEKYSK